MVSFRGFHGAAVTVALSIATLALPAWGQTNCPLKGSDKEGGGLDSALRIVVRAAAAGPDELAGYRDDLLSANKDCFAVTEKYGKNLRVQQCVAESAALLARIDRSTAMYERADCGFVNITKLPADAATKAAAWEGRARNFEAWGQPPSRALEAWREAAKMPTPQRTRAYGKALVADRRFEDADQQYVNLDLLKPDSHVYTLFEQEALKEWAVLRRDLLRPAKDTKAIWARLKTAESNFELANMAFAESRMADAEIYFTNAKDLARDQASAAIATASNYHLAILRARERDWTRAKDYANLAMVGGQPNKRLACLVHIADGEKASLGQSSPSPLCPSSASGSAEDMLVYGAYLLRRAQFLNYAECEAMKPASKRNECTERLNMLARAYRSEAGRTFSDARDARPDDASATPKLNWLLRTDDDVPALRPALRLGEDVTRILNSPNTSRCQDLTAFANGLAAGPEKSFFATLDLLGCEATRTR